MAGVPLICRELGAVEVFDRSTDRELVRSGPRGFPRANANGRFRASRSQAQWSAVDPKAKLPDANGPPDSGRPHQGLTADMAGLEDADEVDRPVRLVWVPSPALDDELGYLPPNRSCYQGIEGSASATPGVG
jgi:hypothetical protein